MATPMTSLTPEQHAARRRRLGGSDIGPMLGLSKWKSPVDLWLEKTGQREPEDIGDRPEVYFGNVLEQVVSDEFTRRTGIELAHDVDEHGKANIHIHPEYDFMVGNVDRVVVADGDAGFEAKTASAWVQQQWGESEEDGEGHTDDVPLYYLTQCAHYMNVLGKSKWYLAVLIGGNDFRYYTIHRDEELEKELTRRSLEFWAHVEHETPPEATSLADVVSLYPRDEQPTILANDQCLQWMQELATATDAEKQWDAKIAALKARIGEYMGDAGGLVDSSGAKIASFKSHNRTTVDGKQLKAELPDIHAAYSRTTSVRPFRAS